MLNMKYYFIFFIPAMFLALSTSCDKVENAYPEEVLIDTTLYPGVWRDYLDNEYPVFEQNTNTDINVLLEDYTGHTCFNCPPAAEIAHGLHEDNPNRVFVASIHIDPGASLSFQSTQPSGSYTTDHTNPDAVVYGQTFETGFNFFGNPSGTVNRRSVDGKVFDLSFTWETRTLDILNENNLKFNLQSVFNYYESTRGGYLHVEAEKLTQEQIAVNTVVYVIQDTLTDWQTMPDNSSNEFYLHRDKHLGSIDNRPFGQPTFAASDAQGTKLVMDYSYQVPDDMDPNNMHFLIYLLDEETYEILQVIKQKLIQ
jgi:hypothetical protein